MKRLLVALLLAAATPAPASAAVAWFEGDLQQAMEKARAEGRLVLVDCWATWCKYCRVMDQDVWSQEGVTRVVERNTVPLRREVDARRGLGLDLSERYGVRELPAVLIIDPKDGSLLVDLVGYSSPERLIEGIDQAYEKSAERRSPQQPSGAADLLREGREALRVREFRRALERTRQAAAADPDCRAGVALDAGLLEAEIHRRMDRPGHALEALESLADRCAGKLNPEAWRLWSELAASVDGQAGRGRVLERWAAADTASVEAQVAWGVWLREEGGDAARSARVLEDVTRRAPDDPLPLVEWSRSLNALGRREQALEALEAAIRLDPHDPDLRELRFRLRFPSTGR
ncbi:MAG: thioredoxin family protein [Acidobacteriota bacterium]|nr:thioredoxin family protein [Acidobacteriota bacterium]